MKARSKRSTDPFAAEGGPEMRSGRASLDRFKPYPGNPRTHPAEEITVLTQILKRRGFDQPIVVDEGWVIIKGHGRLEAARGAGLVDAPYVQRFGLSDEDKKAMRIEDNQVSLLAGWDRELIRVEIESLSGAGYDVQLLGFDKHELLGFMAIATTPDAELAPEPPKVPVSQRGDLWICGDHRILCGDSTAAADVARLLGDVRPHLMVTDPPYGVNYDPNWRNEPEKLNVKSTKKTKAIGKVVNDDRADWRAAWKLFAGDVAYVWCGERQSVDMAGQLGAADLATRNLIVWAKTHHVISRGHYHPQHETCWYAVRAGRTAHWAGDRAQSTLWTIANLRQFGRAAEGDDETGHGTQKPIECMRRPIENNSRPGDAVYEPFAGSGTTVIAAEMTKRRAFALEIDPSYVDVVIERWAKFAGGEPILEATGKTLVQTKASRSRKKSPPGGAIPPRG